MIRAVSVMIAMVLIATLSVDGVLARASERKDKHSPATAYLPKRSLKYITGGRSDYSNAGVVINSKNKNLISLNFIDVDICKALSAIAMEREINISTSKDVTGTISLHLYRVTLHEALNAITLAGGFDFKKLGDLYYVYKPAKERELQADRLQMRIFKLKYVETEKLENILGNIPGIRLLKIHKPTKTIVVEDYPENIAKIEKIIKIWDTMPKQVLIEAKIIEIELTDDMTMGVEWDKLFNDSEIGTSFSRAVIPTDGPVSPIPEFGTGIFGNLIYGAGKSYQFTLAFDALQNKTRINTLSTPRLLAIDGRPARVQVGGQQGYRVTTISATLATETIEFIDTGTILDITPHIVDDTHVLLDVAPSIDAARIETDGIPVVKTTSVKTSLMAKNGQTVFIGGLIQDTKLKQRDIVPFLGDIPVVGLLFGRTSRGIGKSELVVLITPYIVGTELKAIDLKSEQKATEVKEMLDQEPPPPKKMLKELLLPERDSR
jgi:type IV pilus secretin PilQ/predicted competence protein